MRLIRLFIICFLVVCTLSAAGLVSTRLFLEIRYPADKAAPAVETAPDKGAPDTVINIPLSISSDDLRRALAEHVPKTYQEVDADPTDLLIEDELTYDLERGPIDISITKNGFDFSFRVSGVVRIRGKINLALAEIPFSSHATVDGRISGQVSLKIKPDWRVRPDLNFRVKMDEALIPVRNFGKISVRTLLEEKLTKKINKERHKLARKVLAKDRVRKEVARAWEQMHRVEEINDSPLVWVRVIPREVGLMPPTAADDNSLRLGLRVALKTDMGVSGTLPAAPVTPLPDAEILEQVSDRFEIRVPFTIETAAINAYLAEKAAGRSRTVATDITVTAERVQMLSFAGNRLTAIVFATCSHERVGLETAARLYLTGRVNYDAPAGTIRLHNMTYDAAFSRWWAALAHWAAAPYVRHQARTRLVFSLDREIEKADTSINDLIAELAVPPWIKADISVASPRINRLNVNHYGFYGDIQLKGALQGALDFPENGENGSDPGGESK
ncbi:MAG: DUF4403 family protein [Desulfobacterales bacterium]|nr:DUF4403 family protein [Desulfobacterales bacterium]